MMTKVVLQNRQNISSGIIFSLVNLKLLGDPENSPVLPFLSLIFEKFCSNMSYPLFINYYCDVILVCCHEILNDTFQLSG